MFGITNILTMLSLTLANFSRIMNVLSELVRAVPVMLTDVNTLIQSNDKYVHIRNRVVLIRSIALQLVTEVLYLKRDIEIALKDNPEDFKSVVNLKNKLENNKSELESIFKSFEFSMEEQDFLFKRAINDGAIWLKSDPQFAELLNARYGKVIDVSENELLVALTQACVKDDSKLLEEMLKIKSAEEVYSYGVKQQSDRQQRVREKFNDAIKEIDGVKTAFFNFDLTVRDTTTRRFNIVG